MGNVCITFINYKPKSKHNAIICIENYHILFYWVGTAPIILEPGLYQTVILVTGVPILTLPIALFCHSPITKSTKQVIIFDRFL